MTRTRPDGAAPPGLRFGKSETIPSANYGNSNFDIPQAVKGTAVYELPFGMGKHYMNQNAFADAVLGGWRVSGTFIYQSGTPFTVLDDGVNDYSQAGNVFANPIRCLPQVRHLHQWPAGKNPELLVQHCSL